MSARLFVGFPVTLDESLQAAVKKLKIGGSRHEMELNWVPLTNLHVTLNFIGETERALIPKVETALASTARLRAPLTTSLKGLGGYPDERHMRVLYAGVRKSRALAGLQEQLRDALVGAGFAQEDREYAPHLTLARLRKARSGTDLLSPFVRTSFQDVTIDKITLYESHLQGSPTGMGPVYKVLSEFSLSGASLEESDTDLT